MDEEKHSGGGPFSGIHPRHDASAAAGTPPPLPPRASSSAPAAPSKSGSKMGGLSGKIVDDISGLKMQLLLPLAEIRTLAWLKDRGTLGMLIVGLAPLLFIQLGGGDLRSTYWAIAFYFSAIWALYFYAAFAPQEVKKRVAIACFFGTGIFSIAILLFFYLLPPVSMVAGLARDTGPLPVRFLAMFAGVAVPEELCKALALLVILRFSSRHVPPTSLLFYGLVSGLGFGIYEGVSYQTDRNFDFSENAAQYYLLNVIRLTTLPFLHSIWTGIAGYFLALSALYPSKRHGLAVVAIVIPALFHTIHNTFGGLAGLVADALAVLVLLSYMAKHSEMVASLDASETARP